MPERSGPEGVWHKVCVVIPALNEERTIYDVVRKTCQISPYLMVIVVDDGSSDHTAEKAKAAGAYVIRLRSNIGQWGALKVGFKRALSEGFEIVITMDGDGQHDPADIPSLVKPIINGEADLVIGSRFRGRYRTIRMLPYRRIGIKLFSYILSLITGTKLSDVTSGFRAYSAGLLKPLLCELRERQYGILEATLMAWRLNARIREIPIHFNVRKVSKKGSLRFLLNLCRVLLRTLLTRPRCQGIVLKS